uniref:Uncharacterized protein n=1 Tax=Pectinophora gossypiella TaxID=13191 RepID=A0A1E1WRS9_PECGO
MGLRMLPILILLFGCVCAQPVSEAQASEKVAAFQQDVDQDKDDLKTAASSTYTRRYSDWGGYPSGYSGYGVTGYGTVDDKYNSYYGNGYDNTYGYGGAGGYSAGYGGGYGSGYSGNAGYGGSRYGGYGLTGYGNGGYGGYGGNGGLNSYYGYNNPYYQGAYQLGYGYYNRKPGYGNIYSNGITPSLVTGYRGYSRR